MAFEGEGAFRDIDEELELEFRPRGVRYEGLDEVWGAYDKLLCLFLYGCAIFFVGVTVVRVEETLVEEDSEFLLVGE
jgi:hypothetical protein